MRPRLLALLVVPLALSSGRASAQARTERPPSPAHRYVLEARLDPETHVVDGRARITWANESDEPATELWLHLYLNAFESEDTVFMRGSGGSLRGVFASDEGRIELSSLETASGEDLLAGSDDEVIPGDRTQLRVPLRTPVAPGASLELVAAFRSHLPEAFARSGYVGSFHCVAQWFPKLARLEPDGTWATFPYHPHGEFYADFARYELEVDVPDGFVVGATGDLVSERSEGGRTVRRFVGEPVHDAVFVAWDRFEEMTAEADGVHVRVLHPPGYDPAARRHRDITVRGLAHYGRLFGAYPYDTLTVVVPPRGADGAAGMEYPMLFLTAGPWHEVPGVHVYTQDDVTAHELAHMWFQGLVASDEVRWPMLDEGITEWTTGELLRHLYGQRRSGASFPIALDYFELLRVYARGDGPSPPPGLPAYAYHDDDYGRSVYGRTAIVIETVGRTWGRRRLFRALGRYAREQRFHHPVPDDLFRAFDATYWRGFSRAVLEPALLRGEDAELALTRFESRSVGDGYTTEIGAQRLGSLPIPTWIELVDENGQRTRLPWRGHEPRLRVTHTSAARIVRARIDPDRHDLLDPTRLDGERGESAPGLDLFAQALYAVQSLLLLVGP